MSGFIRAFGILTIALYTDGVVPRNKCRPNKAGSFEAVQTGTETALCPAKSTRRKGGVCTRPFAHGRGCDGFLYAIQHMTKWRGRKYRCGLPEEIGAPSWENGVLLTHEGREPVVLRMRMGPMPQDADAFKHVFSLKGSSGQSPCPLRIACTVYGFS